jgi:hypothetical protein
LRFRFALALTLALALMLPIAAGAQNGQRQDHPKITGGGQVFLDSEEVGPGPGSTVAFTVHVTGAPEEDSDVYDARGQFRYLVRDFEGTGSGRPTEKVFGQVSCVIFTGPTTATFGGTAQARSDDGDRTVTFAVDVTDNGQGNDAEDDLVVYREVDDPCDDEGDDDLHFVLARGNLKIHNNPYTAGDE